MSYRNIDFKKIQEKMTFYRNQRKFQLSVTDFTPYFDWYFMLTILVLGILISSLIAFTTYSGIVTDINSAPEINAAVNRKMKTDVLESIKEEYKNRAENLNTLR